MARMLILAYANATDTEDGGTAKAKKKIEALINPESYTLDYKLSYSADDHGQGASGKQLKFRYSEPEELSFDFLLDNTGIIDGVPRPDIADDIKTYREVLTGFQGETHEPWHFKLLWGKNSIFKGRVTELSITHKLFNADGTPIRAIVRVRFKSSIEEMKRVAEEGKTSPDLTHVRLVKAGDTLPLMCHTIYGDSRYYIEVARANGLDNMRSLIPGTSVRFPPIEKITSRG
jgi:hypothetical protein